MSRIRAAGGLVRRSRPVLLRAVRDGSAGLRSRHRGSLVSVHRGRDRPRAAHWQRRRAWCPSHAAPPPEPGRSEHGGICGGISVLHQVLKEAEQVRDVAPCSLEIADVLSYRDIRVGEGPTSERACRGRRRRGSDMGRGRSLPARFRAAGDPRGTTWRAPSLSHGTPASCRGGIGGDETAREVLETTNVTL